MVPNLATTLLEQSSEANEQLTTEDQIDILCDAFEASLKSEYTIDIRQLVDSFESSARPRLFSELILIKQEHDTLGGTTTPHQVLVSEFPEYQSQLETLRFQGKLSDTGRLEETKLAERHNGEQLGHFRLLEQVGKGGFGEVWKATDTRLQRTVALKVPRNEAPTEAELHRFLREGRAAAQLKHPHIVAIHEVGRLAGTTYIASEFVEGSDLRQWLKDNDPSHIQSAELCSKLAEALHHAHQQGIVHRDLKPANVLMDAQSQPQIADFGLAKWADDDLSLTMQGDQLGTPAYMPPEQVRGDVQQIDSKSDVYSLGVVLYELLAGECPFKGPRVDVYRAILQYAPPPLRSAGRKVPRDLETICLKALRKHPNERYATAQEFAVDLQRYLRGEPVFARRVSLLRQGANWIIKRPAAAALLLLAPIALGLLGMVSSLSNENLALLGLQEVTLATEPAGAEVYFTLINPANGKPDRSRTTKAPGVSPTKLELLPGDYWVTVLLGDRRFHEVVRRVPKSDDILPGVYNHLRWRVSDSGEIKLPIIKISSSETVEDMTPVYPVKAADTPAAFFVDRVEYRVADFRARSAEIKRAQLKPPQDLPNEYALPVNYDHAMHLAELSGKRLPSEEEYLRLLSLPSASHDNPEIGHHAGPVGTPPWDCTNTDPPIFGLRTNVSEWVYGGTMPDLKLKLSDEMNVDQWAYRVAYGWLKSDRNDSRSDDPGRSEQPLRLVLPRHAHQAGLGFRGVRSVQPWLFSEAN